MLRRILFSISVSGLVLVLNCSKPSDARLPPGPSQFPWGKDRASVEEKFLKNNWRVLEKDEMSLRLAPAPGREEVKSIGPHDEADLPYELILYFNQDRLSLARILRRDTKETISAFESGLKSEYSLSQPAHRESSRQPRTALGNESFRTFEIYERADLLIAVYRTSFTMSEKDLQGGVTDELECMVFSREENQGISVEDLKQNGGKL